MASSLFLCPGAGKDISRKLLLCADRGPVLWKAEQAVCQGHRDQRRQGLLWWLAAGQGVGFCPLPIGAHDNVMVITSTTGARAPWSPSPQVRWLPLSPSVLGLGKKFPESHCSVQTGPVLWKAGAVSGAQGPEETGLAVVASGRAAG